MLFSRLVLFDGMRASVDYPYRDSERVSVDCPFRDFRHIFQRFVSWGFIPESPPNHVSMCRQLSRSFVIGMSMTYY